MNEHRLLDGQSFTIGIAEDPPPHTEEDHGLELRFVERERRIVVGWTPDGEPLNEAVESIRVLQQRKRVKVIPGGLGGGYYHEWGEWEDVPLVP